jgi:hypothetical protein
MRFVKAATIVCLAVCAVPLGLCGEYAPQAVPQELKPKGTLRRLLPVVRVTEPEEGDVPFPSDVGDVIEIEVSYPPDQLTAISAESTDSSVVELTSFRELEHWLVVARDPTRLNSGESKAIVRAEARNPGLATINIKAKTGTSTYQIRVVKGDKGQRARNK